MSTEKEVNEIIFKDAKHPFWLGGDKPINNLAGLKNVLIEMDDTTFYNHVSEEKNDFANWIRHSLEDHELADNMVKITNREELIKFIDDLSKTVSFENDEEKEPSESDDLFAELDVERNKLQDLIPEESKVEKIKGESETTENIKNIFDSPSENVSEHSEIPKLGDVAQEHSQFFEEPNLSQENSIPSLDDMPKLEDRPVAEKNVPKKKKGFFSKIFGKDEDNDDLESIMPVINKESQEEEIIGSKIDDLEIPKPEEFGLSTEETPILDNEEEKLEENPFEQTMEVPQIQEEKSEMENPFGTENIPPIEMPKIEEHLMNSPHMEEESPMIEEDNGMGESEDEIQTIEETNVFEQENPFASGEIQTEEQSQVVKENVEQETSLSETKDDEQETSLSETTKDVEQETVPVEEINEVRTQEAETQTQTHKSLSEVVNNDADNLKEDLKIKELEIHSLNKKIKEIEKDFSKEKQNHDKKYENDVNHLTRELEELKQIYHDEKELFKKAKKDLDSKHEEFQNLNNEYEDKKKEFQQKLNEFEIKEDLFKKNKDSYENLKRKLDQETRDREQYLKSLEVDFEKKNKLAEQKIQELRTLELELEYKQKDVTKKEKEFKEKEEELENRESSLTKKEKKIDKLFDQAHKREEELDEKEKELIELKKEIEKQEKEFKKKEKFVDEMQESLKKKEDSLALKEKELNMADNALDMAMKQYDNEKDELDDEEFHQYLHGKLNEMSDHKDVMSKAADNLDIDSLNNYKTERQKINKKIEECKKLIRNNDFSGAKIIYNGIRQTYYDSSLDDDEKEVIHNIIRELYDEINLGLLNK